jgi:hypothetical protein
VFDPVPDCLIVAFDSPPRWPLPGPAQLFPQQMPDMCWMVRDAAQVLDHLSHAWQRPQIGGVSVGLRALGQRRFDLVELLCCQLRSSARSPGPAQAVSAIALPHETPVRDNLMRHAYLATDFC